MVKKYSSHIGGRELTVELNRFAHQANGSAVVRYGDTVVLVIAVINKEPKEGGDFFPLTCDYEERFYAAGRISGSRFIKREGRPSQEAVLTSRLIDRSIRPRFDQRTRNEVQVVATVLSFDGENDPDIPALLGASIALSISDIPWDGPIAGVRIGKVGDTFIVNPTAKERDEGVLDLTVSGLAERINMIEAGARELGADLMGEALELAHQEIKKLVEFQNAIIKEHAKPKIELPTAHPSEELAKLFDEKFALRLEEILFSKATKLEKYAAEDALQKEWKEAAALQFGAEHTGTNTLEYIFHEKTNEIVHARCLKKGERVDGRAHDELRQLSAEVGALPRVHGSAVFRRGETEILSVITLGAPSDEQLFDTMEGEFKERFMHHYNFAKYSSGEVGRLGNPGRREIGHGALAERALKVLMPDVKEFPYTIRAVSETLTSNGSTSMASVSASSMALMDAGVPIKKAAGGIAMGLMMADLEHYTILTDIQGPEDHYGDMDFKVAGTRDGITALQMDVKIEGVTPKILREAIDQATRARMQILDVMDRAIAVHRPEPSERAPRVYTISINPEKIRDLIGPGGKMINAIMAETGVQIDVEDDGTVFVTAEDKTSGGMALEKIKQVTKEIIPGEVLEGRVTRLFDFGAMVEVGPKQEGLVHISELAPYHVEHVTDIVNIGDVVPVKVKEIDGQGRINLSLKDVPGRYSEEEIAAHKAAHPETSYHTPRAPRREGGGHSGFGRSDRGRGPRRF